MAVNEAIAQLRRAHAVTAFINNQASFQVADATAALVDLVSLFF